MDKTQGCGPCNAGSNPTEGTMKTKIIVFIVILIAVAAVGAFYLFPNNNFINKIVPANQPQKMVIQEKQINDSTKPFIIKIVYPQITGLDAFNKEVQDAVDKEINDFKTNSLANDEAVKQVDPVAYAKYPREYELDISYDKGEIDNDVVSVMLNVYNFEGGAHGASYFVPINYNPKLKQNIKLADLFGVPPGSQSDYLQKISDYCTKDLTKQLTKALGSLDGTSLQEGAGPSADNFQFFLINPNNTITFYFPQYQVAFGAAGDFKVTMPK